MKKQYLMMAVAASMLAACSQTEVIDEVVNNSTPKAIEFTTFVDNTTRAENSIEDYSWDMENHHDNYTVYGYKTVGSTNTDVFTKEERISVNSSDGTYSPKKYWDNSASQYGFFACAGNATFDLNDNSSANDMSDDYFTITSFSVSGKNLNASNIGTYQESFKTDDPGKDLMIAAPCEITSFDSNVNLEFNHILSRLNVTVKTTMGDNVVTLKEVAVMNMKKEGSFNENSATGDNLQNGTTARWGTTTGSVDYTYNNNNFIKNADDQYVIQALVMPQSAEVEDINLDGSNTATSSYPYIKIKYSVTEGGVEQPDCEYYYNLAKAFTAASPAEIAFNEGWENTLNIIIKPTAILFDANVAKWDENEKNDFTIEQ